MPSDNTNWWITGGRLVDPASGSDTVGDLFVVDGRIVDQPPPGTCLQRLEAAGWVVIPGLVDLHTHLREPGDEIAETVASGTAAAARGGFTTLVAMPNTRPPMDTPARLRNLAERVAASGVVTVLPCGCLTHDRAGAVATDLAALKDAGAMAFSDDGSTPLDDALFSQIARAAHELEMPILDHAEDVRCSAGGVMHSGACSQRLGLPGIPEEAELLAVDRDIRVAAETGCHLHIQHVSSARAVERIRRARDCGWTVSAEVTPHHLAFCDADVDAADTRFKMNPPLRTESDRQALLEAVADGTLTVLATDHAPHSAAAKARGFLAAPFGVTGLETALAVTFTLLVVRGGMPLRRWLRRWTTGPTRVLGRPPPRLEAGAPADIVVFDPARVVPVEPGQFLSLSANSPFIGTAWQGRVMMTLCRGKAVWMAEDLTTPVFVRTTAAAVPATPP